MTARDQEATPHLTESPRLSDLPDLLTVDQVAAVLRIGRGSVYQAVKRGELPMVSLGRRLLIPKRSLMLLAGMEAEIAAFERAAALSAEREAKLAAARRELAVAEAKVRRLEAEEG